MLATQEGDLVREPGSFTLSFEDGSVRKTAFLSHVYIKTIILPRQARDKHRESTQNAVFRRGL